MKPNIRSKSPVFSARPGGPNAAGRVLQSIQNITRELEDLQMEIYSRMGGPVEMMQGFSPRERDAAQRSLNDFKLALDQLRYVLWLSTDPPMSENPAPAGAKEASPQHGNNEAGLAPAPPHHDVSTDAPTSASFFDRLDVVIEAYLKSNTPTHSSSRKRPKT